MWVCTRCQAEMDDNLAICRACGGIRADAVTNEEAALEDSYWACRKCGTKIEAGFAVCWMCGTSFEGVEDPNFAPADQAPPLKDDAREFGTPSAEETRKSALRVPARTCGDCAAPMRSIKLIDKTHGGAHAAFEYAAGTAERGFWLGRFPVEGSVEAWMCIACGRITLFGVPQG